MLENYYRLTKPGIVYGNAITTLAAFLYASRWHFSAPLFFATMIGIMLVIASACVFNNYFDREIDARMERTKGRALAAGSISNSRARSFGVILAVVGFALLALFVNLAAALTALVGFFVYTCVYTFSKRISPLATLIGSISGAMPIVVGYTAVTNSFDAVALVLFLILVAWQMPHFYAIAIRREDEYRSAKIPVLPTTAGRSATKKAILAYTITYLLAAATLAAIRAGGLVYLTITLIVGLLWLAIVLRGFRAEDDFPWAKKVFLFSLVVLLAFSAALSIATIFP